jgi:hypothetical protein
VRLQGSTPSHISSSSLVQALRAVGAASNNVTVVVVLAVVLPAAFVADFIGTSLGQRCVAAAWTGIKRFLPRCEHASREV